MKQYKLFSLLAGVSLMAFTSCDLEEMPTTSIGLDNNEEAVINGTQPLVTGEDGLYPILIAAAATKSLKEGRPVKISEIEAV